jgi:hypothetical protein
MIPAFFFTRNSVDGAKLDEPTKKVIKAAEENSNFKIHPIVTDMGSSNVSMWNRSKINQNNIFTRHPNDSNRSLFYFADPCHLIKNFLDQLLNQVIPKYFIESNNLKCNIVSSDCIKFQVDFQENNQLKL